MLSPRLLRDVLMPQLQGNAAFQARVAANAVDLAAREMRLGPGRRCRSGGNACRRCCSTPATLDALEAELALAIRSGAVDRPETRTLRAHLWISTLDKLAIDQPAYAPYRRAVALRAAPAQPPQE